MTSFKENEKMNLIIELYDTATKSFKKKESLIIEDSYICLNKDNKILNLKEQSEIDDNSFLFHASINTQFNIEIDNLIVDNNIYQKKEIFEEIDDNLWYIIQSNRKEINGNYFLTEGDIIKLGNIKFLVNEINLGNKVESEKKEDDLENNIAYENINIEAEPYISNIIEKYKYCRICSKTFKFSICECEKETHFSCFQEYNTKKYFPKNNNNTKKNDPESDNNTKNDNPESDGTNTKNNKTENDQKNEDNTIKYDPTKDNGLIKFDLKQFFCENCQCQYSFRYILQSGESQYSFNFEPPDEDNYIILESLGTDDKIVYVIILNKEKIKIGNGDKNDINIEDESIKEEHAVINYDEKKGKIGIESLCEDEFNTCVLVRDEIEINQKEILLKAGKNVFIVSTESLYDSFDS